MRRRLDSGQLPYQQTDPFSLHTHTETRGKHNKVTVHGRGCNTGETEREQKRSPFLQGGHNTMQTFHSL